MSGHLFDLKKLMFFILFPSSGPHEAIATNGVLVVCVFFPRNFL